MFVLWGHQIGFLAHLAQSRSSVSIRWMKEDETHGWGVQVPSQPFHGDMSRVSLILRAQLHNLASWSFIWHSRVRNPRRAPPPHLKGLTHLQTLLCGSFKEELRWSSKWQPTPVFLFGKSHGQKRLVGYSSWGCKESDKTEHAHISSKLNTVGNDWLFLKILKNKN